MINSIEEALFNLAVAAILVIILLLMLWQNKYSCKKR